MLEGLRYAALDDRDRHARILVCYPLRRPDGDPWGVLSPLRGTTWGTQIPTVGGDVLSHALHGHVKPLREVLGRPPRGRALKISMPERLCLEHQQGICANAGPDCFPGSTRMPGCYVPPGGDPLLAQAARAVAVAWDEGRYVFVVEGDEFVVR